jgi:23S rRNA (adenine1618-N6)-methyltransferase
LLLIVPLFIQVTEMAKKKIHPKVKTKLHPRNKHNERYDFIKMIEVCPDLKAFVTPNAFGDDSIDFANPNAVRALNRALLETYYGIQGWNLPEKYLCPPIPGRADYIHNLADLLRENNFGNIPNGSKVRCLDIGTGASVIYPLLGVSEYGWQFVGTDISQKSLGCVQGILESNSEFAPLIETRLQSNEKDIFKGVIQADEKFDVTLCNPPFHSSQEEAIKAATQKVKNLNPDKLVKPVLNFGGKHNELFCDGGEERFIQTMIRQSRLFQKNCFWFTTLVSKQSNLPAIYDLLEKAEAVSMKTIPMGQGNKISRIVVWTFLTQEEQKAWKLERWK